MPLRSWLRVLPALAAAALMCVAATAPPLMPAPVVAPCGTFAESGGGDSTLHFQSGDAVRQPLPWGMAAAACSVRVVASGWTSVNVALLEWDPVALAPAAGTIALRTAYLDPSRLLYYTSNSVPWTVFEPALVTRSVAGVAERPRLTTAFEVRSSPWGGELKASYTPDGTPSMPAAVVTHGGSAHDPLQGSHPVLAHAICDGGPDLQSLRVVQCVKRTDVKLVAQPAELLQRFRVPERAELSWVELAVDSVGGATVTIPPPAVISIVDATGMAEPPAVMPPALVEATFEGYYEFSDYYEPAPRWASHLDFDHTIALEPGHDYWLYVHSANGYRFRGRALTGEEGAAFKWGIGTFYTRAIGNEPWSVEPARALSFVLIGRPEAAVSVPPRLVDFDLRVAPNPARRIAEVSWSGAVGPVRFEVFDARGRRVATSAGGAAGAWRWEAKGPGGEPLPAGVYFIHARDSQGTRAMGRAVVVR